MSDNIKVMRLVDILTEDRIQLRFDLKDKTEALTAIATSLALGTPNYSAQNVAEILLEREKLQSTGIGDGVAIPHGFLLELDQHVAALLVVPNGVYFDAIDHQPAKIIFGVVGPKRGMHAQVEHLRVLARISKMLREPSLREQIIHASNATSIYHSIQQIDEKTS